MYEGLYWRPAVKSRARSHREASHSGDRHDRATAVGASCLDKYDCLHIIRGDYLQVKGRHRGLPLRKPTFSQTPDVGVTPRGYPLYSRHNVFQGGPQKLIL